ncbi:uncharacterized protein F58A4.6 [Episyrphus balteatus]|uniref:uncharacterized protein F58A4.6 n=1 Tax=Episyrphus balteatus TaxID=286459 RepID=UPI0024862816|nr:uncharacterized protein F58A4.6 [Episyrphus balteatus]
MAVTICISDYFNQKEYFNFNEDQVIKLQEKPSRNKLSKHQLRTEANGQDVYFFIREILNFTSYRQIFYKDNAKDGIFLLIQIVRPEKEAIDYKWNVMTSYTIWEKIEVDYLMSWLSTLGGGFSALGEQFSTCAETAGKISLRQLQLGLRLGDPFLQARCKLYYSISLIQTGQLRYAKYIIREQYKFARQHKATDSRLVKMCFGIWHRLEYEYMLKQKRKQAGMERKHPLVKPTH